MSRLSRSVRIAVAGLFAVSALTIFGASPASAATGSLVDDGNGGLVVTYSSPTGPGDYVVLEVRPSGSSCSVQQQAVAVLSNDPGAPQLAQIAASPATIVDGMTAYEIAPNNGATFTFGPVSYTFCLLDYSQGPNLLAQLTMTIGQGAPTTTTTTTVPSTTTTASATPVAPAFTG
jgi:hypothetical protein